MPFKRICAATNCSFRPRSWPTEPQTMRPPSWGWLSKSSSGRLRAIKTLLLQGFTARSDALADVSGSPRKWGNGGTAGTRTQDQSLKRALLYQLSYRPPGGAHHSRTCRPLHGHSRVRNSSVTRRIRHPGGGETGGTQPAGIALSACPAGSVRLIAGNGHAVVVP